MKQLPKLLSEGLEIPILRKKHPSVKKLRPGMICIISLVGIVTAS